MVCDACGKKLKSGDKARKIIRETESSVKTKSEYIVHPKNYPGCRGEKTLKLDGGKIQEIEIIIE